MALPVEVLRALMDAGASPEAILAAAEAAEARERREREEADRKAAEADEERRARAREKNRERQRRWYDSHVRDNCDNAVRSQDNAYNGVMQREDVRSDQQKKVLEPKKNPTGIITSSTPSGSQVSSPSKPRRHDWPEGHFEAFWSLYPRKTDRKKALAAWMRLHRADQVALSRVMDGVNRMIASGIADEDDKQFVPHPTTFLNNARYDDEWPVRRGPSGGGPRGSPTAAPSRGNGLSEMGKLKGQGDVSVYRDPFAHLDGPRPQRAGRPDDQSRARPAGGASGYDEAERGRLLDFDRLRAGAG